MTHHSRTSVFEFAQKMSGSSTDLVIHNPSFNLAYLVLQKVCSEATKYLLWKNDQMQYFQYKFLTLQVLHFPISYNREKSIVMNVINITF